MQQYHPDKYKGGKAESLQMTLIIREAYEVLIDHTKRADHDRWIVEQQFSQQENNKAQKSHSKRSNTWLKNNSYVAKELFRCFARIFNALREIIIVGFIVLIVVIWSNHKTSEYKLTQEKEAAADDPLKYLDIKNPDWDPNKPEQKQERGQNNKITDDKEFEKINADFSEWLKQKNK
jgi:curved DNA-binding protein CbpA